MEAVVKDVQVREEMLIFLFESFQPQMVGKRAGQDEEFAEKDHHLPRLCMIIFMIFFSVVRLIVNKKNT